MKQTSLLRNGIASLVLGLTGFGSLAAQADTYKVGYNNWVGFMAYMIAQKEGKFAEVGLEVEGKSFDAPGDGLVPLLNGDLDAHLTTLDAVILRADKAPGQFKIVGLMDTSKGADAVVGAKGIESPKDLKGKKVGVTFGECGHLLLSKALEAGGLKEKDVELVNMTPDDAGTALKAGQVDAAVTWEPWITQIIGDGGAAIYSTEQTPNLVLDCIAISKATADKKKEETQKFLAVIDETTDMILKDPAAASAIASSIFEIPADEIEEMLKTLTLYNAAGSKEQMGGPVLDAGEEIVAFFEDQDILATEVDVKALLDTSMLP